jgi:hypothetical protein
MIDSHSKSYAGTSSKLEKHLIVSSTIKSIEVTSPRGIVVRQLGDVWYKVDESALSEKCDQR